ncbi:threonine synthase [Sphingosinicella rhizophila]|uniref:Threonine synthase n=1 Tax=Sphingosinicella rhizophila TaxID=3050082 RepID=A0ABU3Q973_9SPHN|nr:threonine synthase [Sphingosinicella sp. GR2756]MDT9599960.1 threonine synthase [Sphingosinicella sp. GR2756]
MSSRGSAPSVSLSEAIRHGAAPDGGLYLPAALPDLDVGALRADRPLADFAATLLAPFFAGDRLEGELPAICREALDFPVPMVRPYADRPGFHVLELFHGPTGAFKDFGARFLMACFDRIGDPDHPLTVLAATSGDTGGAVGCAAEGRRGVRALILYPKGRVSPFQELQLTCWNDPVRAFEVAGDFDDCQTMVKAAFADPASVAAHRLTSANSINIGRLLPQMTYWSAAAVKMFGETGKKPGLIIPTGNLGHAFAALYIRAAGVPIGPVVIATNANRTLSDWHRDGHYAPRASVATIANAMDVGAPSNFERLVHLPPDQRELRVELVDDDTIAARIKADHAKGYLWCPHSAIAAEVFARLGAEQTERPWIAGATAHPYKFADVLEPLVGQPISAPPALAAILDRKGHKTAIGADVRELAPYFGADQGAVAA